ncbi:MAG: recombinase family protein, partial [Chloroflexia bacterium]
GGDVALCSDGLLSINDEFTASIVLARCATDVTGRHRWIIHLDTGLKPDIHVVARMDSSNAQILDYFLLPRLDMTFPKLRLAEANGVSLDCYRFDDLQYLFQLGARTQILEVA